MAKRKRRKVGARWGADELKLLKKIFANRSTSTVAKELGRSVSSVQAKASAGSTSGWPTPPTPLCGARPWYHRALTGPAEPLETGGPPK